MANTDAYAKKSADNYRIDCSKLMLAPANATYNIIKIPAYALVTDVWIQIVTAFTEDASVIVGWMGNGETAVTDGFITTNVADPKVVGLKRAFNTTESTFPGKYFTYAGAVTTTLLAGAGVAGNFRVFIQFTVIHV